MLDKNKIYHYEDTVLLSLLDDEVVDVFWGSPPFNLADPLRAGNSQETGIRRTYADATSSGGDGHLMEEGDYQYWQECVLNEIYRVLKSDGVVFYSHKPRHKDRQLIHPLEWVSRSYLVPVGQIIWDKGGTPNVETTRLLPVHEIVLILAKSPGVYIHNPRRYGDIWSVSPEWNARAETRHPAPANRVIVEECLKLVPDIQNKLVLDCWGGSGTTALAAKTLGADYIIGDISEEYCQLAEERLEDESFQ